MNHCVPDFEIEDDDSFPTSSRLNKPSSSEEDLMEIIWRNGHVVMNNQNQRSLKKFPPKSPNHEAGESMKIIQPSGPSASVADPSEEAQNRLFMQEDEMASWLHYPIDDSFERDFCADLIYPAPSGSVSHISRHEDKLPVSSQPPIPPPKRADLDPTAKLHRFMHFPRPKTRIESQPCFSDKRARELTVVDSSETPVVGLGPRVSNGEGSVEPVSGGNLGCGSMDIDAVAEQETDLGNCEMTVTSSSDGGSGASASASAEPSAKLLIDYRKRKAREKDNHDCQDEGLKDAKFESAETKKQVRGSTSARRTRAAEVHNLSERRRRDRINEKMKALQELIPRCNKSDKASMLDEAIVYLKSLQLQVQMMSMGCSMVPMMFPGVQQYMSPMGMGMGLGMGMGMDMGLSRPMLRFTSVLPGSSMATPPTTAHFSPRLPMPAFHLPPASSVDPSTISATNHSDPTLNSNGVHCPNPMQVPNFADPYQHYLGLHHMQVPPCPPQNQVMAQPSISKGIDSLENHKDG